MEDDCDYEVITGITDYAPEFVKAPDIDARTACASAIKRLLEVSAFTVWGSTPRNFRLKQVTKSWPEPDVQMAYPCASIIDLGQFRYDAHNFVPTPCEETFNKFGDNTMVWRTSDLVGDFQVDMWTDNEPEREAMAASLSSIFNQPGVRYGVVVRCGTSYFQQPVRLSLVGYQRMDSEQTAYIRERRLMVQIRAEIPEVHLRQARAGQYSVVIGNVGEQVPTN